jgi:hypothetical protein
MITTDLFHICLLSLRHFAFTFVVNHVFQNSTPGIFLSSQTFYFSMIEKQAQAADNVRKNQQVPIIQSDRTIYIKFQMNAHVCGFFSCKKLY